MVRITLASLVTLKDTLDPVGILGRSQSSLGIVIWLRRFTLVDITATSGPSAALARWTQGSLPVAAQTV